MYFVMLLFLYSFEIHINKYTVESEGWKMSAGSYHFSEVRTEAWCRHSNLIGQEVSKPDKQGQGEEVLLDYWRPVACAQARQRYYANPRCSVS